ncbi:hypothetical protein [Methylobacterium crusticola]|uniref:hypothetical protein n=1 Tax=Methylobacterium crusticola TaxID=1697972 RepID=UPI000FFB4468|nr:hypothetical protein [Methylobacterium crusticola]
MTIEEERVAFVIVLWAVVLGFIGFASEWSVVAFAASYVSLGVVGLSLLWWRKKAERSAPIDPQLGVAVALGAQVVVTGVHAFWGEGTYAGIASAMVWGSCAVLIGAYAIGRLRVLRQRIRARDKIAALVMPSKIEGTATPLKIAFARARAIQDMTFVLPVFLYSNLFVVARKEGDHLNLNISPSPAPDRFFVIIAESQKSLSMFPPNLIHAIELRTLLTLIDRKWDIVVVYGDGKDVLSAEYLPELREMLDLESAMTRASREIGAQPRT